MQCFPAPIERTQDVVQLVAESFGASEGEQEGRLIGRLTDDLLRRTPAEDRFAFVAEDAGALVAAIVFSRLRYPEDGRRVFLLAPVAVATARQRQGIGQRLLHSGLDALRAAGVEIALTYGDPRYYAKLGFKPLGVDAAQPPLPLRLPHGWLGQSLSDQPLTPLRGPSFCVDALNDPAYW
jgi:putative acetyltransferase